MFKRKVYDKLLEWKNKYSDKYAVLLEGARRVGKSTIATEFAKNEYKSYILIDFANINDKLLEVFEDISNLDIFFLRLQTVTQIRLYEGESVIIFDEIQLFPKARQAIKYLVKDGRYSYIETGSLISIKKNVKNIVIPSEEYKISVYPMDYEEFLWATKIGDYELLKQISMFNKPIGDASHRTLMRNFRIYMAVGGMPQSVEAFVNKKSFEEIDFIKREIISLYMDDFRKIDPSGRISMIFQNIPTQLALNKKRFILSSAINKRITSKDEELLNELIDSKTVLISYNTTHPSLTLSQNKTLYSYKLYLADVGLFTTMIFNSSLNTNESIYQKLLSNKLDANLGYLYENAVAQIIKSCNKDLYYHTWQKNNSTHYYEIDFLFIKNNKVVPIEVKSGMINNYYSLKEFCNKYSKITGNRYILCQKDFSYDKMIEIKPLYMLPFILNND